MKINQIKRIALITMIVIFCLYSGMYIMTINSDPYKFAVSFLQRSTVVHKELGSLKKLVLRPFGYSMRYSVIKGEAQFIIWINGSIANGNAYLLLEKDLGQWKASKGRLVYGINNSIPLTDDSGPSR